MKDRALKVEVKKSSVTNVIMDPPKIIRYYTILPLLKERLFRKGFSYVATGDYQLPLFEGEFPKEILSMEFPYKGLEQMLSNGTATLSETGASIFVRIKNPLISTVTDKTVRGLNTEMLRRVLNAGNYPGSIQRKFDFVRNSKPGKSSISIISGGKQAPTAEEVNKAVSKKLAETLNIKMNIE